MPLMPVWLATPYRDYDDGWVFVAAPTRTAARAFAASQWGDGAHAMIEARACAVRPDGKLAGRGYRGPQATVEAEFPCDLSEREVNALGFIACERCESYQRPLPDGRCQQCAEADEDDRWEFEEVAAEVAAAEEEATDHA